MKIIAFPTDTANKLIQGGHDANNQTAEVLISDGNANECRHCMQFIAKDEPMLLFAHRPFETVQAFAELGPVLMHQHQCERYDEDGELPSIYASREMIIRAYTVDDRIIYGTGRVIPMQQFKVDAQKLLDTPSVAYLHVRSASNNCYHFRVER